MRVLRKGLAFFASLRLTVVCLSILMGLVFFTTMAQVNVGILEAKRQFFSGFFVWRPFFGVELPILPSGLVVGWVLFFNLIAAHTHRFKWQWSKCGIWLTHSGLIVLLIGSGLTNYMARETQMPIREGESTIYSQSVHDLELAVVKPIGDEHEVSVMPYSRLKVGRDVRWESLPITVIPRKILSNSQLVIHPPAGDLSGFVGVAAKIDPRPLPLFTADHLKNIASMYVEVFEGDRPLGVYLLSNGLALYQTVATSAGDVFIALRERRDYNGYRITLDKFSHDLYPGTQIPKNFSSKVRVTDLATGETFQSLIWMNNPLRHQGKTYYQASYADNNTVSIFQVVENPSWLFPYIASIMMGVGLLIQFGIYLVKTGARRASK